MPSFQGIELKLPASLGLPLVGHGLDGLLDRLLITQELHGDCPGAGQTAQGLPGKVATAARSRLRIARNCLETALGRPGCPGRPPQLPGAAQRLPRLTKNCPGRPPQLSGAAQEGRRSSQERPRGTAQEGRHSCPVQSIPRSKPMTDKATKMCWPDRSSTSLSVLSSRGGCREAHLDKSITNNSFL